jgi:hypothetical protein
MTKSESAGELAGVVATLAVPHLIVGDDPVSVQKNTQTLEWAAAVAAQIGPAAEAAVKAAEEKAAEEKAASEATAKVKAQHQGTAAEHAHK